MRNIRTLAVALAASVALVVPLAARGAADAASPTPGSYQASATGDALAITVGGTQVAGGDSAASGASTPTATATGSGQLLPTVSSSQSATAAQPGVSQDLPQSCGSPALPALPAPFTGVLTLAAGCGSADAAVDDNGLPSSDATGSVGSAGLGAGGLLSQVIQSGTPVVTTLQGVFGMLPTIPVGGVSLGGLLTELGASAVSTTGLVSVAAGSTTSTVATTATTVTATSTDSGANIGLLTGAGADGGPLLDIRVGAATSTSTLDRGTAAATAVADPGLVTVTFGTALTGVQTVTVAPGQSQTFLSGTPLASTVDVGAGAVTQGTGQASSTAHGVTLDLLQGVDGGVDIDLATSTTAVAGVAPATTAAVTPTTTAPSVTPTTVAPAAPAVVPGVTTVHTGEPWGGSWPVVVLAVAIGLVLVYRRRLALVLPAVARSGHRAATPRPGGVGGLVRRIRGAAGGRPGDPGSGTDG